MTNKRGKPPSRRYADYTGDKQWKVTHPLYGDAAVYAPTEQAAIVAAASVMGQKWTALDFYSRCRVVPLGTRAKPKGVAG